MGLFDNGMNTDAAISFQDNGRKLALYRYGADPRDLPLLRGSRIEVEEDQYIAFIKGHELADVWDKGSYQLTPDMFLMLEEKGAFPYQAGRPVDAELYFINQMSIPDNPWGTVQPALIREDGQLYRVRAYGRFDFRIKDAIGFMLEGFLKRRLTYNYDIIQYLKALVASSFTAVSSELAVPLTDVINHARDLSELVRRRADAQAGLLGLEIPSVLVEGSSLAD